MEARQRILVVGAGPSGLAALKEMREVGMDCVAVDSRCEIGGVFSPKSGVTFEGLHVTTSNFFLAFSDFPPKDKSMCYWSQQQYWEYLVDYANHFKLMPHIKLNSKMQKAKLDANKKWQVSIDDQVQEFDYLIMATGANHTPKIPEIFQDFAGKVMHSSEYHSAEQVRGQRVLVVGTGESATDVCHSAGKVAENVTVWGRWFPDMAPRFIRDILERKDMCELNRMKTQDADNLKPAHTLEILTTSRICRNLPLVAWSASLHALMYDIKNKFGKDSPQQIMCDLDTGAWSRDRLSSDHADVPTKSTIMASCSARGELDWMIAPTIKCVGKKVAFNKPIFHKKNYVKEGTENINCEFDVIVACTGYSAMALESWLEIPGNIEPNPRTWFKHCFPPKLHDHVAFLGYARPHSGGIPQCSEVLARYIAQLRIGNVRFPANAEEITRKDSMDEEEGFQNGAHNRLLVDYYAFMMSVGSMIGCTPKMPFTLAGIVKHWTYPLWPCFFRTRGPGANQNAVDEVLNKFGTYDALAPMPLVGIQVLFTFVMPFVNFFSWLLNPIIDFGKKGSLPRMYRWRMSKFHFMYSHMAALDSEDFKSAFGQLVAGFMIVVHAAGCFVSSPSQSNGKATQEVSSQHGRSYASGPADISKNRKKES